MMRFMGVSLSVVGWCCWGQDNRSLGVLHEDEPQNNWQALGIPQSAEHRPFACAGAAAPAATSVDIVPITMARAMRFLRVLPMRCEPRTVPASLREPPR